MVLRQRPAGTTIAPISDTRLLCSSGDNSINASANSNGIFRQRRRRQAAIDNLLMGFPT
jgi:hypothetical protein